LLLTWQPEPGFIRCGGSSIFMESRFFAIFKTDSGGHHANSTTIVTIAGKPIMPFGKDVKMTKPVSAKAW
jgi:hypothetical protein